MKAESLKALCAWKEINPLLSGFVKHVGTSVVGERGWCYPIPYLQSPVSLSLPAHGLHWEHCDYPSPTCARHSEPSCWQDITSGQCPLCVLTLCPAGSTAVCSLERAHQAPEQL